MVDNHLGLGLANEPYICTVYDVHLLIYLPKLPYNHRIYMVLANPDRTRKVWKGLLHHLTE